MRAAVGMVMSLSIGAQAAEPQSATTSPRRIFDPYPTITFWSSTEQRTYRTYLEERHRRYVAYERQRATERRAYWRWRRERDERLEQRR